MIALVDFCILALLAATAVTIVRLRSLFAAVMLMGIYSLLSASWMLVLDAPDVAFTEAAVGAGISTVLMLGTLALTSPVDRESGQKRLLPLIIVVLTGAALAYGTVDMPFVGDPDAPAHRHVAPRYLQASPTEIGVPNVVTSVLASYRGYDTLGETAVILTAGLGVLLLLRRPRREDADDSGSPDEDASPERGEETPWSG